MGAGGRGRYIEASGEATFVITIGGSNPNTSKGNTYWHVGFKPGATDGNLGADIATRLTETSTSSYGELYSVFIVILPVAVALR